MPGRYPRPGRRAATATICLLVVLSGCSAVPGIGGGDGSDTTTAPGSTVDDADLPPGITGEGLTDSDALVTAHRSRLASDGFVYL